MHNRQNENIVLFNCIEDSVRKLPRHTSPNVIINWSVTIRGLPDSINRILDHVDECLCNLYFLFCVVSNCLRVFRESFWVKHISHGLSRRLTCAKASSPGIVCTEPSRTSSLRLFASVTQTAWIIESVSNSRLSTNLSARSALDPLGKDKISSVSCSIDRISSSQSTKSSSS